MARKRTDSGRPRKRTGRMTGARRRIGTMLPAAFRSHLKASIREGLLAFESLFVEAVKALEQEGARKSGRKARKIKLE